MSKPQITIILFLVPIYSIIYSGLHVSTTEVIRILPDSGAYLEMYSAMRAAPPLEYSVLTLGSPADEACQSQGHRSSGQAARAHGLC